MASTLVLGGARSGKSAYAQIRAQETATRIGGRLKIIVTAQPLDEEMKRRIARHQGERGQAWTTVEAPYDLQCAIKELAPTDVVVVDCLTLWLSNIMLADGDIASQVEALSEAIEVCPAKLWLVSNEVGQGIVPENALARRFVDEAGLFHQRLGTVVDEAVLLVAGFPVRLKPGR